MKANANTKLEAKIAFLLMSLIACHTAFAELVPKGWQIHRDHKYGFSIEYPSDFAFYTAKSYSESGQRSFIPICQTWTVACFEYSGNKYEGTNLEAAGLAVSISPDIQSEQECAKIDTGSYPIKKTRINGISFHYGITDGVATGHALNAITYRTFHDGLCFEISRNYVATNLAMVDPGVLKQFNPRDLDKEFMQMIHSLKFLP